MALRLETIGLAAERADLANDPKSVEVDDDAINLDGISLAYLHHFVDACGGRAALKDLTTADICTQFILPATEAAQTSACNVLTSFGRADAVSKASWFVSHVWKYPFLDVLDALDTFFTGQAPATVFVWFDLFTNSQHNTTARKIAWWKTTFMEAVKQIGNFVVILQPWNNPLPLTRAWCVFELYSCHVTESRFHVAMTEAEEERFSRDIADGKAFYNMLATINSSKATAWNPSDRDDIFKVIQDSVGFAKLDRLLFDVFGKWMQETLLERVERAVNDDEIARWEGVLAFLYLKQGLLANAEPLFVDCLERRRRVSGEDHPATLNYTNNLAVLYDRQGLLGKAEPLYAKCFETQRRILGEEHPDTLTSAINLAGLFQAQGLFNKAEPLYLDCVNHSQRTLGKDHLFTLTSMASLAFLYEDKGLLDKAEALYLDCLERRRRVLGDDHPDTISSMNDLANLYQTKGQLEDAEALYVECLERRQRLFGDAQPDTLISANNLATLYSDQGRFDKAEPLFVRCLEQRRSLLGEDHPDTLEAINNLAALYRDQKTFDKAVPLYVDVLERYRRVFGEDYPRSFFPLNSLAVVYHDQGLYEKAEALYVECLERRQRVLGDDHPDTAVTREKLAKLRTDVKVERETLTKE
ncbi:Kinesin light chain 3 [Phlyctochytrium bullatum]|nr:Kinesin light chain 3 [Phlyctochytrium bullatum]